MNENQEQVQETQPEVMQIVEQPVEAPVTETMEAQAARYIAMNLPMFRLKLRKLEEQNKREVARVLSALIESPLEQETHQFTTPQAEDLFNLGLMITNAKFILFNTGLKVQEQEVKSETVTEKKEE